MIEWLKSLFRTADPPGQLPRWNGPASPAAIAAAEVKLGVTLPEELRALYLRHDGVHERNAANLKYRLMPLKEAVRTHRDIPNGALLEKYSMRCFFSGEDCAGVYCGEPFTGYLFFLHHDSMYLGGRGLCRPAAATWCTLVPGRRDWSRRRDACRFPRRGRDSKKHCGLRGMPASFGFRRF
jgi:hypothetical protein